MYVHNTNDETSDITERPINKSCDGNQEENIGVLE